MSGWVSWRNWSPHWQGRNEVRWRPGQDASSAPSFLNLSTSGSKCTVLKNVRVTLLGVFGVSAIIRRPRSISAPPATDIYVGKNLAAMWQKCIKRARLAQRIMTYVTMQLCNSSLHIHGQRRGVVNYCQGHNEVRWRPGQEANLAPLCLNLRSSGSKCTALKFLWHF